MKILIDSGATNSVINRKPAFEKFFQFLYKEKFSVSGLGSTINADDNLKIPLLYELEIFDNIHLHVVDWHTNFDALLGTSDLQRLGAKIDYQNHILEMRNLKIPFNLEYSTTKLKPNTAVAKNFVKIPVSLENGDVLLPEINFKYFSIPECISHAKNGICLIPISKSTKENIQINFSERIPVQSISETEIGAPQIENTKFKLAKIIRTTHMNSEEKREILKLCSKFKNIFYNENCDLSFSNTVKHKIRTKDDEPVHVKSFRHPHSMKTIIQEQIQKLLDDNIIRPSISPYSAPVWIVDKKKDASGKKKYRMVIDYRRLNEKTIEDKYPLPRIEEILDNLGKSCYFSTLDMAKAFHQIEMDEESIEKTAFSVNNGHYEYLRMPYGLKNGPSTFQRVMDNVLKEYLHKFCFVYMDDIVVFSKSLQEHIYHLQLIFQKIREFNLKIELDKCEFLSKNVEFLGHLITPEGISPNPTKLKAVENYPIPRTVKEIKSFLGLIGYYRRFIENFAHIVSPMTKCLKKGAKIKIDDPDYENAFYLCKELLTNAPILVYPDFEKPFKLTTDASNVAIGSVLSQGNRPVAYYSRTLNSAEKNYSTIEKELLSILDSTKHFRPYLYGQNFTIETDHNPLVWLYKIKEPNSRLIRWKLKLDEFDFNIIHKKGKENKVADALSRIEINNQNNEDPLLSEDDLNVEISSILPNVNELPVLSDEELENILNPTDNRHTGNDLNNPTEENNDDSNATIHSTQEDNGKAIPITESSVNIYPNRIILNIGEQYNLKFTKIFQKNNYNITIRPNFMNTDFSTFFKEIFRPNESYGIFFRDNKLRLPFIRFCKESFNYSVKLFISNILLLDVSSEEQQFEIISEYHDKNHNGISETFNQLSKKYYWPKMKNKITEIINKCELCLRSKYERNPYKLKFSGPLLAKRPFEVIHIDTFSFQNSKFLTIIDLFSKYAQSYLIKDGTALTILNKLRHYFSHHNIPQKIVCDEGREFQNKTFTEFCKLNKINLHFTTVNNPSSNSPIERFHSTILEKLRILKLKNPNENPANLMITATLIYNQSIHSATGYSPFHLLYGPYDKLPEFDLNITIYEQYNEKRKQEILPFFDHVYERNKDKAQKRLTKLNENRNDPPNLEQREVYVERNRPRKTDPPFEKIVVGQQQQNKISGLTTKSRETTAHIQKVKKLRKNVCSFQDTDNHPDSDPNNPGPSGIQNKK